jgi:flagellar assembly protein FliH
LPEAPVTPRPRTSTPVAFEFGSPAGVPDAVLAQARSEASAIGYAHGWAQGIREARETQQVLVAANAERIAAAELQSAAELRAATEALMAAATKNAAARDTFVEMQAEKIIDAAFSIAEALVGLALKLPEFAAPAALARVLAEAPPAEPIVVRMNPNDRAVLTGAGGSHMMAQIAGSTGRELTLQPDPQMPRGDAIAHFGDSTIDGRISAGLERVRERLAQ